MSETYLFSLRRMCFQNSSFFFQVLFFSSIFSCCIFSNFGSLARVTEFSGALERGFGGKGVPQALLAALRPTNKGALVAHSANERRP